MNILICKECSFHSDQSSTDWKVIVIGDTGHLQCPKCGGTEFIRIKFEIEDLGESDG
jgi:hypothetical protein